LGLAALFLDFPGIGILVPASLPQQEALLMTFATALPTVYLSGFLFPSSDAALVTVYHLSRPGSLCDGHHTRHILKGVG
jgi:hypothetical protein